MKKIFILFTLLAIAGSVNAQTISRKVVSSAGGTLSGGGGQITFSIGETFIPSLSVAGSVITQGFQQPGEQVRTGAVSSTLCAGSNFNLPYTATDIGGGNTFTAQLSNATGSFASPVNIGTLTGNASAGVINVTIPSSTVAGTGYRVRITSSSPAFIGTNNGANISINAIVATNIAYSASSFCKTGTATVTRTGQAGGIYTATPAGLSISSSTGLINLSGSAANSYTVTYSFSSASCSSTTTTNVTVNAIPAVPIVGAQNFCGPTTVASLPSGGGSYKWYSSISSTVPLVSSTILSTGTYYVSNASGTCESARASVSVSVGVMSTASISYKSTVMCGNGSEVVKREGQSGGTYSASPAGLDIDSSTGKIRLKSSALGDYIISYSFGSGFCTDITTTTVSVIDCATNFNARLADTNAISISPSEELQVAKFDVVAYPNPSAYQFNVVVESSSDEKIVVVVYDLLGKMLKQWEKNKEESIIFGSELPTGVYTVIVSQGSSQKTIRVVKQ